jgi:uncharacterized membrane protein
MRTKLIDFNCLFLLLLVTGVFWGTWFSLSRTIEDFSLQEFIHIGKVIIANVAIPMSIIMPACIFFMLLSLWIYSPKKSLGFYLDLTAFLLIVLTLLITLLILVPIDDQIKLWTVQTDPADWKVIRDNWQFYHTIRTFASLTGFVCYILSLLGIGHEIGIRIYRLKPF